MPVDAEELRARTAAERRVVRVVVAEAKGSAPREAGAAMVVGPAGVTGTIGGGALEFEAIAAARTLLARDGGGPGGETLRDPPLIRRRALGPDLGQCCGGAVTLVWEVWDDAGLAALDGPALARPVTAEAAEIPLALRRALAAARSRGEPVETRLVQGWLIEPVAAPQRQVWIWGAGHVGRALVSVLSPLPGLALTWVDTAADRFPAEIPGGVTAIPAADPATLAAHAPARAEHLVLTYSHALDLALCDALLRRGFGTLGLIGSATKWTRFRRRLRELGHADAQISRIRCPIGEPALGKHPQAIALGVAACILREAAQQDAGTTDAPARFDPGAGPGAGEERA